MCNSLTKGQKKFLGSDAGADIEHLRHHATHANVSTTGRYNRRTVEKTRKVAELRVAHRGEKNG